MTDKLYHQDAYQRTMEARVRRRLTVDGRPAVILDQTVFYATGGGQEHDTGILGPARVLDVREDEASGDIIHVLDRELPSDEVTGTIDWDRRFDLMQQHSGQHILSQAFERVLTAETVSVHLGREVCTVDIAHPQLKPEEATQVEDLANSIIYENRPILTYQVTPDQVGHIPLRKPPAVQGMIRIVEVQGFDYSACGGTHVRQTGEIGLIKIRKWERRGTVTRVDFYCGRRALLDYRWKNAAITTLAGSLNLKDRDVVEGIQRALAAGREAMKALEEAREKLLDVEARHLLASAAEGRSGRLVVCLFEGRPVDELRRLALRLTAHPGVHALLGSRSGNQAALVFARSPDLTGDMSTLLQAVIHQIGGRGGGSPTLAQGGGPRSAGLQAALDEAVARLSTWSP